MNRKNKSFMTKRKAFTLIELLIVIAIIGILFIVLVSKVDFATDKSKATGVQTDFRSFQVAIESVAKENAGLSTFGWDTGDTNGDRVRNSYDKGDTNKNGVQDDGEVFIGSKTYGETWTNIYTLTNPADANDKSAIVALEEAINKNLDPKLHITIADDLTITMANGAQDPWDTEYHGFYITNATVDKKDRGAIIIYSNGANQEFGSTHSIAGGVVTVNVPGNNVYGKDDYSIVSVYTYVNGYGEVKTTTTGFSQNQGGGQAGSEGTFVPGGNGQNGSLSGDGEQTSFVEPGLYESGSNYQNLLYTWDELFSNGIISYDGWSYDVEDDTRLVGDLVISADVYELTWGSFDYATGLTSVVLPENFKGLYEAFYGCSDGFYNEYENGLYVGTHTNPYYVLIQIKDDTVTDFVVHPDARIIAEGVFDCPNLVNITLPDWLYSLGDGDWIWGDTTIKFNEYENAYYLGNENNPYVALVGPKSNWEDVECPTKLNIHPNTKVLTGFALDDSIAEFNLPNGLIGITQWVFCGNADVQRVDVPNTVKWIGYAAFKACDNLKYTNIPNGIEYISAECYGWDMLESIVIPSSVKEIGAMAFAACENLKTVTGGANVKMIREEAFEECTSLTAINFTSGPAYKSIDGILYTMDGTTLVAYPGGKQISEFEIPSSVTTIEPYAFCYAKFLRKVIIPDTVTKIGAYAFQGSHIAEVHIGSGISELASGTFQECYMLKIVKLSEGLVSINKNVFYGTYIASMNIPSTVTSFSNQGKCYEVINMSTCYVNGTVVHDGESSIVRQGDYLFIENNGENYLLGYTGTSDELVLPSDYNGESYKIADYAFCGNDSYYRRQGITSVVISDGVTSIGNYAFAGWQTLKEIIFDGSFDEWLALPKTSTWNNYSTNNVVCLDSLIEYEWSELKTIAQQNLSADELKDTYGIEVGDYKVVDGIKYVLVDIDGNDYDGFVFMYYSGTTSKLNSTATNQGGYVYTDTGKAYVDNLYINLTDTELKKAIKQVTVTCDTGSLDADGNYDNGKTTYTTDVYMFLASSQEVGYTYSGYKYSYEGSQFDFFTNQTARANFSLIANVTTTWWLRTAEAANDSYFFGVPTSGAIGGNKANTRYGIVATFVIG